MRDPFRDIPRGPFVRWSSAAVIFGAVTLGALLAPGCENAVKGTPRGEGGAGGVGEGGVAAGGNGGDAGGGTAGMGGGGGFDGIPFTPRGEGRFFFGAAVAVGENGTVPSVLVGAHDAWVTAAASGAAYVFVNDGSAWSEQAELTPDDPSESHHFGWAVAIDGDTALIGAPFDDEGGSNTGAAYVFVRTAESWTQQDKLFAMGANVATQLGTAVALSGDTAVLGAPRDNENGGQAGAAHVFVRNGQSWTVQAKLIASDGAADDDLGRSVAIDGDTIVVGAKNTFGGGPEAGAAYVFVRAGMQWTEQAKLTAGTPYDHLGSSVAIDGDRVVVTAVDDETQGDSAGAAYVFERSGETWSEGVKLVAPDGATFDRFGMSVSLRGDRLLVGANGVDGDDINIGAAYVFVRDGGGWQLDDTLRPPVILEEQFGEAVSLGDTYAAIGAPNFDDDLGKIYIWTVR